MNVKICDNFICTITIIGPLDNYQNNENNSLNLSKPSILLCLNIWLTPEFSISITVFMLQKVSSFWTICMQRRIVSFELHKGLKYFCICIPAASSRYQVHVTSIIFSSVMGARQSRARSNSSCILVSTCLEYYWKLHQYLCQSNQIRIQPKKNSNVNTLEH